MNRKLLALAIGAAFALPLAAHAAPTVYGQLDVSLENVDDQMGALQLDYLSGAPIAEPDAYWRVRSNSSRFGIRGSEEAGDLSVIYQVELGLNLDSEDPLDTRDDVSTISGDPVHTNASLLRLRNSFVGVSGGFGTVKLGRIDSPLKSAQGNVDLFNDTAADMANLGFGENRLSNVIMYESPKLADAIQITAAIQPGEEGDQTNGSYSGDGTELANAFSVAVTYSANGVYAALAMDSDVQDGAFLEFNDQFSAPNNGDDMLHTGTDSMRAVIGFTGIENLALGLMYETREIAGNDVITYLNGYEPDDELDGLVLSAGYTMDSNTIKFQYGASNYTSDILGADVDMTSIALGVDHAVGKFSKVYAYYNTFNLDSGTPLGDLDTNILSVGVQTKF